MKKWSYTDFIGRARDVGNFCAISIPQCQIRRLVGICISFATANFAGCYFIRNSFNNFYKFAICYCPIKIVS